MIIYPCCDNLRWLTLCDGGVGYLVDLAVARLREV